MSEITASLVKELRELTSAGMMDCKKALQETYGSIEDAIDWLRKKGVIKASKKSDREASEGLISCAQKDGRSVLIELNSETDFVSMNTVFQQFLKTLTDLAIAHPVSCEGLLAAKFPGKEHTVQEELSNLIATIGENITLRRVFTTSVKDGVNGVYVHGQVAPGLGTIGVVVVLKAQKTEAAQQLAYHLAMHVAAADPLCLRIEDLNPDLVEREVAVLKEKNQHKPEAILDKIVGNGLKSWYKDVVFLEQAYIHDPSQSVRQVLAAMEKTFGEPIEVLEYKRFSLGEGSNASS